MIKISEDRLIQMLCMKGFKSSTTSVLELIEELPKERKKTGEWISFHPFSGVFHLGTWYFRCSRCGELYDQEYNYCPNCGAEMRKEEDGD